MKGSATLVAALWAGVTFLNVMALPKKHLPRVKSETVVVAPLDLTVRAAGSIEPERREVLKAPFDGPVLQKLYKEGDLVKAGQLLIEIGRDKILSQHTQMSNELKNAERGVRAAVEELRLQKALYKKKAVARSAIDGAELALESARQKLEVVGMSVKQDEENWNNNFLKAESDGTVTRDDLGDLKSITSGKDLLTLGDLSSFAMQVLVDELDIGRVKEGQSALVRLQAYEDQPLKASVGKIGARGQGKGITQFPVDLRLESTGGLPLRPQLSGESRIIVGVTEPVPTVPLAAIASREGERVVWVIGPFGRLKARPVELGRSNPDRAEVVKGLKAGERVCAAADPSFRDGMRVIAP